MRQQYGRDPGYLRSPVDVKNIGMADIVRAAARYGPGDLMPICASKSNVIRKKRKVCEKARQTDDRFQKYHKGEYQT